MFGSDIHLPISFKDIVEFYRPVQYMGQSGLSHWHNRMGNAAPKPRGFRDLIGMQEFAQYGTVDYAFMGAVCNTSDKHGNLSSGSWDTQVYGAVAAFPLIAGIVPYRASLLRPAGIITVVVA